MNPNFVWILSVILDYSRTLITINKKFNEDLHMKFKTAAFAVACLASLNTQAGMITNGDFENDYLGWSLATDSTTGANDFSIDNSGSNKRAAITIDSATDAYYNTLYQALDFTGAADSTFQLSFDFAVETQSTSADEYYLDYFSASLYDGASHYNADALQNYFLISDTDEASGQNGFIDGSRSGSLSFNLANSFTNTSGWFLDFTLNTSYDYDASTLYIDNVSLIEVPSTISEVPEPTTLAIFALGLAGLFTRKQYLK